MFNVILIALEHCSRSFNYAMGRESQKQEKIYELSNFTENIIFKSMTIIACLIHFFLITKELMLYHLSRSIA